MDHFESMFYYWFWNSINYIAYLLKNWLNFILIYTLIFQTSRHHCLQARSPLSCLFLPAGWKLFLLLRRRHCLGKDMPYFRLHNKFANHVLSSLCPSSTSSSTRWGKCGIATSATIAAIAWHQVPCGLLSLSSPSEVEVVAENSIFLFGTETAEGKTSALYKL